MSAALAFTPASGSIVHTKSAVRVDVTGADSNTSAGAEIRYYIKASKSGSDDMKSYVFSTSSDGKHSFNNFIFPAAGTWTVELLTVADVQEATASVVVS